MSNNPAELQEEKEKLQAASSKEPGEVQSTESASTESPSTESTPAEPQGNETGPAENTAAVVDSPDGHGECAPGAEAPATEAPATEAPATEAPATEEPATEEPATEEPASDPQDGAASTGIVENQPASEPDDATEKTKIKIGSQRTAASDEVLVPKAVKDAQETTVPIAKEVDEVQETVPAGPSVDDLSEQWEKEAAAGLDGKNVNELMDQAAAGADLDLPVNSRVKGTVTKVFGESVFFLLKGQYDGVVASKQFKKEPEPGTMTDVVVNGFNAEDNLYELSLPGATVSVADWSNLAVGNLIEVRITGSNTGGLECLVNNIRGFIPASQIDISRVDNLGEFVNKSMECVITEANKKKKNLVLSRRAILEKELKERKKEILEQFEVGSTVEGKISKLREFGAFVNIGSGVEGLVHISKCSWHHIKHPNEVFEDGQEVSVRIERINKETGKIQLSHRDTVEHPWKRVAEKYPVESTVNGTVSKIADFGAFVKLETGVEGLVHISEIAHERVKSVADALTEGQEIEVKILSLDPDKQKMSLSIKALLPVPVREEKKDSSSKASEPAREMAVKKRNKPLRGGTGGGAGGDQFGLKW